MNTEILFTSDKEAFIQLYVDAYLEGEVNSPYYYKYWNDKGFWALIHDFLNTEECSGNSVLHELASKYEATDKEDTEEKPFLAFLRRKALSVMLDNPMGKAYLANKIVEVWETVLHLQTNNDFNIKKHCKVYWGESQSSEILKRNGFMDLGHFVKNPCLVIKKDSDRKLHNMVTITGMLDLANLTSGKSQKAVLKRVGDEKYLTLEEKDKKGNVSVTYIVPMKFLKEDMGLIIPC